MYKAIYDIDNLYLASHNALKGKKSKVSAAKFWLYEDREILQMHRELREKRAVCGGSTFEAVRGTTIWVFVSSKLFVPEFFVVMQKSVPFKVHYLLREICSNGEVSSKNCLHFQRNRKCDFSRTKKMIT